MASPAKPAGEQPQTPRWDSPGGPAMRRRAAGDEEWWFPSEFCLDVATAAAIEREVERMKAAKAKEKR